MTSAYECIITTPRFIARETNRCWRFEVSKSHAYTYCRTKYLNVSVDTRNQTKIELKTKLNSSGFNNIPAIAEIVKKYNSLLIINIFYNPE